MRRASDKLTGVDSIEFVLSQLPPKPARVLEFGAGGGRVTRAVAEAGYDVVGIDPGAPAEPLFRRLKLEDVDQEERFDAIVAVRALHHVGDLEHALERIATLLEPSGTLVLDELAWDRLDETTADWFYGQRRALAAAGRLEAAPDSVEALRADWEAEHVGLHGYEAMRAGLDERFEERLFEWVPALYRHLAGVATRELEQTLVETQAIQALGFRYVGVPREA